MTKNERIQGVSSKGLKFIINPSEQDWIANPYEKQENGDGTTLIPIDEDIPELAALHLKYALKAYQVYSGRNRNTFILSDRIVVKLPRNFDGFTDNDWEGSISNSIESFNHPEHIQYPKTKLVFVTEVPIVFMQRITPLQSTEITQMFGSEPDWTFSVDCGQVGITRQGRLVAYDYGLR